MREDGDVMRLAGQVAIVTGAGSGIGRATARLFAQEGAAVVCVDWAAAGGNETVAAITAAGGNALFAQTDVSRADDVARMVEQAVTQFGGVDILVNNAAINGAGRLMDLDEAEWERILAINLKSVFLCTRAVVPPMRARGRGAIVNVSSILGFTAFAGSVAYCTAKAGILGFTRAVALDLIRDNIRVNAIAPGSTDTPLMWDGVTEDDMPGAAREVDEATPIGRIGEPAEIARAALFLVSDDASFVVGTPLIVDGGLLAKCPAPR